MIKTVGELKKILDQYDDSYEIHGSLKYRGRTGDPSSDNTAYIFFDAVTFLEGIYYLPQEKKVLLHLEDKNNG